MATQTLDPQIVNLTKAIRQTESGGNFTAQGASGEYGAYQFTQPTWDAQSKKYGVNVALKDATPEQQNEVAYKQIADWKAQGNNVGQIASMWNAGQGEPNAYTGTFSNGKPSSGTNSYGVKFDVPAYAKSVATAYQTLKAGGQVGIDPNNPSSVGNQTAPQPPSVGGFVGNIFSSAGNLLGGLGNVVAHPIQTAENLAGTAVGGIERLGSNIGQTLGGGEFNTPDTQKFDNVYNYFGQRYGGKSVGEVFKNIGNTLYKDPVGAALDVSTLLDGVGGAVESLGKVGDVSRAAELAKASDFISTAKGLIAGGTPEAAQALETAGAASKIGAGIKSVGEAINPLRPVVGAVSGLVGKAADIADSLPRRIINNLLPQLKNPDTINYAIDNLKLGSVDSMVKTSSDALNSYDAQIKAVLTHPDYADTTVEGTKIIDNTLAQFPNSEYTQEGIIAKIKSQIPGSAALVTKLENGSLSLDEANTLRQAIDRVTYKVAIDSPEVRAGKELASAFGNSLRTEVKTLAPETVPIFDGYSKEINLQKALTKLALKSGKAGAVSMKELLAALGATGVAGPIGGGAVLAAEKVVNSPAFKVGSARLLKNVISPALEKTSGVISASAPAVKAAAIAGKISNASKK